MPIHSKSNRTLYGEGLAKMGKPINIDIINEIRELQSDSDPGFFVNLLNMFIQSIPERLAKIEKAFQAGNADLLRAESHGLKSSSANLGATQMADFCARIEQIGRGGSVTGAADLIKGLKAEIAVVVKELENLPEMKNRGSKSA